MKKLTKDLRKFWTKKLAKDLGKFWTKKSTYIKKRRENDT